MENIIPHFIWHALIDSLKLVPFLFVIFVFIEIFENYYSKKITFLLKYSKKIGPIIGAILATVPQCGFSIIASLLYIKNFLSLGTLISVYIATSDEAIPVLFAQPEQFKTVGVLICLKIFIAVLAGYIVDLIVKKPVAEITPEKQILHKERGCCNHHFLEHNLSHIFIHPIKHTFLIFLFIFAVCIALNYIFEIFTQDKIESIMMTNSLLQPIFAGIFGLIPNCAVSVLITMMYLKGVLSFGSVIAGLSSGAGLGLIVLLKKNKDMKDTLKIISILLLISIFSGILIDIFC